MERKSMDVVVVVATVQSTQLSASPFSFNLHKLFLLHSSGNSHEALFVGIKSAVIPNLIWILNRFHTFCSRPNSCQSYFPAGEDDEKLEHFGTQLRYGSLRGVFPKEEGKKSNVFRQQEILLDVFPKKTKDLNGHWLTDVAVYIHILNPSPHEVLLLLPRWKGDIIARIFLSYTHIETDG